jgi:hypothetical protein
LIDQNNREVFYGRVPADVVSVTFTQAQKAELDAFANNPTSLKWQMQTRLNTGAMEMNYGRSKSDLLVLF